MKIVAENIYLLNRYFNLGCLSKWDQLLALLNPQLPFHLNSSKIFNISPTKTADSKLSHELTIEVPAYSGKNETVIQMKNFLQNNLSNDLHAAIVHGSLGTGEEINYSDFDGLIILKNEIFQNRNRIKRVAQKINESYSIMIKMDPLQHHGWFILRESDLQYWPATFFPPVLFEYSKSIFQGSHLLSLKFQSDIEEAKTGFDRITASISSKLSQNSLPENLYQVKNLFSEFMLLPSLYLQVKNNSSIFKKFSFDEASKDFIKEEWEVMNEISLLREHWPAFSSSLKINAPCRVTPQLRKKQIQKSYKISEVPGLKISRELPEKMLQLVNSFKAKLK